MSDIGGFLGSFGIAGAIGKAIVQLELDSKKYLGEMRGAEVPTVASANSMSKTTSAFGSLSTTVFLGAGVAVAAFGAYAVKAAVEANDAQNKLANTFKNNAMLSDSSMEAFTRQTEALRDLTGVDDEAIIGAQALLGHFKLTGQQVMDLIPLIVDLSAKMGIDLGAAAKAVGKATLGSTPEPWPATASRSRTLEARTPRSTPSCRAGRERSEASPRSEGQRNPGGYSVCSSRRSPSRSVRLCSQCSKTSPRPRSTNRRPAATCLRCAKESPQLGKSSPGAQQSMSQPK